MASSFNRYFSGFQARVVATALILLCHPARSYATLYVILLDSRQIAIASDSRLVTVSPDHGLQTRDGADKVIFLGPRLVFMSSGLAEITTKSINLRAESVAKTCYSDMTIKKRHWLIRDLAVKFAETTTEKLNRSSGSDKIGVGELARQLGSSNGQILESMFAGADQDLALKTETVDIYLSPEGQNGAPVFKWIRYEAIGSEQPHLILSGEIQVLQTALQAGSPPIAELPSFQIWAQSFQSKPMDPVQTVEALANLGIQYAPPREPQSVGYPIFVYQLKAGGFFGKLKTVAQGKALGLPN